MGDPSSPAKRNVDPVRLFLASDVMKECVTLSNVVRCRSRLTS